MTTYPFHLKHKETNIVFGGIYSPKDGMLVTINNWKHAKMHRLIDNLTYKRSDVHKHWTYLLLSIKMIKNKTLKKLSNYIGTAP